MLPMHLHCFASEIYKFQYCSQTLDISENVLHEHMYMLVCLWKYLPLEMLL